MEEKFENIRQKYHQLWSESKDMIFISNSEYQIIETNPSFQSVFGYIQQEIVSLKEIFEKEEDFVKFNQNIYKKEHIDLFEVRLRTRNNETIPCLISFFKSVSVEGIETYMGIIKNISKRKRAEKQMITSEKLAVTGKIARNIAHEVRNPLTNLNLALDQLKEEIGNHEEASVYTEIIERNAKRIQKLIGDLLDSSKSRQYDLQEEDINKLLQEALNQCHDRIVLQNIKLINNISNEKAIRLVDSEALITAFLNLIINAIEAMKPDEGVLEISSITKKDTIVIQIKDNGSGMDEETLKHIFDPFFSRKQKGNGLGLTNVQNIINGLGGHIEVESSPGEGSSFLISFN